MCLSPLNTIVVSLTILSTSKDSKASGEGGGFKGVLGLYISSGEGGLMAFWGLYNRVFLADRRLSRLEVLFFLLIYVLKRHFAARPRLYAEGSRPGR
jgi:hypothetical protein